MSYDRERFVEAEDGTRLFVEERGEGDPAIVLTDGIGCDGFAWRYLVPRLSERHRVVHWHFRGHGRSGGAGVLRLLLELTSAKPNLRRSSPAPGPIS